MEIFTQHFSTSIKTSYKISAIILLGLALPVSAKEINNASFEKSFDNWKDKEPSSISSNALSGKKSAKITGSGGHFEQEVKLKANTQYRLRAYVDGKGRVGIKIGSKKFSERTTSTKWEAVTVEFNSGSATTGKVFGGYSGGTGRFDDFSLAAVDNTSPNNSSVSNTSSASNNSSKLDPSLPPSGNFDLSQWNLSVPTDVDGNKKADNVSVADLNSGYKNSKFFYTAADGGMVFKCPISGYKTSNHTTYTRVELREMLRGTDTSIPTKGISRNNWVFSSAPSSTRKKAGAVNGNQKATLAINHVTTTGDSSQVGRVIIGQIHANDDEPIRIYYRKLPGNTRGSIYFAHESRNGPEIYVEMVGSRSSKALDPSDGIALGDKFSYEIDVKGNTLKVILLRPGKSAITKSVSMKKSGYDDADQYMYFKAGVYNQNKTGDADDYVQVTFYALEQSHD